MSLNIKVTGSSPRKRVSSVECNNGCYEDSNTLTIIEEFKQLYEEKMRIIDKEGKGDATIQAKLSLQQDWISDLTEQNEMLVRAVEELEQEATDRVLALEAKLAESSKSACEVMNGYKDISFNLDETFQQMIGLQNDVKNLIRLIHKAQDEGVWNLDGLQFCTVDKRCLLRSTKITNGSVEEKCGRLVQEKNEKIKHLEMQICELSKAQNNACYEALKQSMLDMRDALTAEVADKHDSIVTLKRDVQLLEEQCRKADQQTHFKDDIIKELRKELKQIKNEPICCCNRKDLCDSDCKHKQPSRSTTKCLISKLERKLGEVRKKMESLSDTSCNCSFPGECQKDCCCPSTNILRQHTISFADTRANKYDTRYHFDNQQDDSSRRKRRKVKSICSCDDSDSSCSNSTTTFQYSMNHFIIEPQQTWLASQSQSRGRYKVPYNNTYLAYYVTQTRTTTNSSGIQTDHQMNTSFVNELFKQAINDEVHIRMQEQHQALVKDLYEKDKEICDLRDLVSIGIHRLAVVFSTLDNLEMKASNLNYEETNKQLLDLQRENDQLQEAIAKATSEFESFEKVTEEHMTEKNKMQESNNSLQAELNELIAKNEKLRDQYHKIMDESSQIKATIVDTDKLRKTYDESIETLQKELVGLRNEYADVVNNMSSLKNENCNQCYFIQTLQQRLQDEESQRSNKPVQISATCSPMTPRSPRSTTPSGSPDLEFSQELIQTRMIDHDYYGVEIMKSVNKNFSLDSGQPSTEEHGLRSETSLLEGAVHDLKDSVSRIIGRESESKQAKKRIAELEHQLQRISKKDEIIGIQNDTLTIVENELQAWRAKEEEVEEARRCREREIFNLKEVIDNLARNLDSEKKRSENLQHCVDEYVDSINTLQDMEKQFKKEISDQRLTINNLQEALVATKLNLEEQQQKASHELSEKNEVIDKLKELITRTDRKLSFYLEKCSSFTKLAECLRDENLSLEVELFYNAQDLDTLEARSLKYQQLDKELQIKYARLQHEMQMLEDQRQQQTAFVDDVSSQLAGCQDELKHLFKVLNEEQTIMENESVSLTNHVMTLQTEIFNLSQRLSYAMKCLDGEKQTNSALEAQLLKIEYETNSAKNESSLLNEKFLLAKRQAEAYYSKSMTLEGRLKSYEDSINLLDNESKICETNLGVCMENLARTQESLVLKCEEFNQLSDRYKSQALALKQLQDKVAGNEGVVEDYKRTINSMNEKVAAAEDNCQLLQNEITALQTKLSLAEENEEKLVRDYNEHESQHKNKLNVYENEQTRLLNIVSNLEQRLQTSNSQLVVNEQQLEKMKAEMSASRSNLSKQAQMKEDECSRLRTELNGILKKHVVVKAENDVLQSQITNLRAIVTQNEDKGKLIVQELQQCLADLQMIQNEKTYLMQKNEELMQQINSLQHTCQNKTESVVNLEMELNDTRCMKDTLCNESRTVINNVKNWLQEQRRINQELSNKMRSKNEMITKLNYEKSILENKMKTMVSQCYISNDYKERRRQDLNCPYRVSSPPSTKVLWSLGSNGSGCCSSDSDWETTDHTNNGSSPQVWLHRVESMTEQVQESSRYFKNRLGDRDFTVSKDK